MKPKNNQSYSLTTIIGITLVLFLLGVLCFILLNAHQLSVYVKENIGFSVILNDDVKEVDQLYVQKMLDASPFVKQTHFIHKDSAATQLKNELGEDFIEFLGYNPLHHTIDVKLKAQYAHVDSLTEIRSSLIQTNFVSEVVYRKDLIAWVDKNIKQITLYMLLFSSLLLVVAIALINNTIRLKIYAQRFLIKTMQLVGAKNGFIRKPFVIDALIHGLVGASLAFIGVTLLIYYIQQNAGIDLNIQKMEYYIALFGLLVTLGILISWISTSFAVSKYLRAAEKDLY